MSFKLVLFIYYFCFTRKNLRFHDLTVKQLGLLTNGKQINWNNLK